MKKKSKNNAPSLFSDEELEQVEQSAKIQPKTPVQLKELPLLVYMEGGVSSLLDRDIDALERQLGPCENDHGVSLWRLLREAKKNGARSVSLI